MSQPLQAKTTSTAPDDLSSAGELVQGLAGPVVISTDCSRFGIRSGLEFSHQIFRALHENRPIEVYSQAVSCSKQLLNYFAAYPEKITLMLEYRVQRTSTDEQDNFAVESGAGAHIKSLVVYEGTEEFDRLRKGKTVESLRVELNALEAKERTAMFGSIVTIIGGSANGDAIPARKYDMARHRWDVVLQWWPLQAGAITTKDELAQFQPAAIDLREAHRGSQGESESLRLKALEALKIPPAPEPPAVVRVTDPLKHDVVILEARSRLSLAMTSNYRNETGYEGVYIEERARGFVIACRFPEVADSSLVSGKRGGETVCGFGSLVAAALYRKRGPDKELLKMLIPEPVLFTSSAAARSSQCTLQSAPAPAGRSRNHVPTHL